MKICLIILLSVIIGCNSKTSKHETSIESDTVDINDKPDFRADSTKSDAINGKVYSNTRFKDVIVERLAEHKFLIQGKGQIFESSFSWVVEDGHKEIQQGFQMTDEGAPEWGKFSFTLEVEKTRDNSTLTLILFESSPKDGSRQHELPIFLY